MKVHDFLILILLSACLTLSAQTPDSLKYVAVDPEVFFRMMKDNENTVLIDVRMPFEFRNEHIEKAANIPLGKTGKKKNPKISENQILLLYCKTDLRSRWAAVRYYDLGFQKLYILKGGIEAWKRKGLEVAGRLKNSD